MTHTTAPAARDDFWRICGAIGLVVAAAVCIVPRQDDRLDAGVSPTLAMPTTTLAGDPVVRLLDGATPAESTGDRQA